MSSTARYTRLPISTILDCNSGTLEDRNASVSTSNDSVYLLRSCEIVVLSFGAFATFIQVPTTRRTSLTSVLRHLDAVGLVVLAILDSSPIPTFGGPVILTVILVARPVEPWYYQVGAAILGSPIAA